MFRNIVVTALLAGSVAGLLLTAIQLVQVIPLIEQAEYFEAQTLAGHNHDGAAHGDEGHGEENRFLFTAISNLLAGIGFGLVLTAAMSLRGHSDWRRGLLWGLAGYLTFFVAPSLGMPPDLPGSVPGILSNEQLWWAATAIATGGGLALLLFGRNALWRGVGLILLAIPHLVGAPQPLYEGGTIPNDLAHDFLIASAIANGLFWLALGGLSGTVGALLDRHPAASPA